MNTYQIGCGGIGTWVTRALAKTLTKEDRLWLIDGDKLETRNLDRQLFTHRQVGMFKAHALGNSLTFKCGVVTVNYYLGSSGTQEFKFDPYSMFIVAVDNHPARVEALFRCDDTGSFCIIAANEYEDAEAFYYQPSWKDTPKDPRIYYPELLEDHSGDPLHPACTGEEQEAHPQLAIANMCAASYAMWLFWFWTRKAGTIGQDPEVYATFPVHVSSTAGRMRIKTIGDYDEP